MDDSMLIEQIKELYECTNGVQYTDGMLLAGARIRKVWTKEQDLSIVDGLKRHGCKWRAIAKDLNLASDDAIRNRVLRWKTDDLPDDVKNIVESLHKSRDGWKTKYTDSTTIHKAYTLQEDQAILDELRNCDTNEFGRRKHKWQRLQEVEVLSSRTTHSIRNRAHRLGLV